MKQIAVLAQFQPQSAYCGVQRSLQHEYQFLQRVVDCDDKRFQKLESVIEEVLLPKLMGDNLPSRDITSLRVRDGGMGLPNPTK